MRWYDKVFCVTVLVVLLFCLFCALLGAGCVVAIEQPTISWNGFRVTKDAESIERDQMAEKETYEVKVCCHNCYHVQKLKVEKGKLRPSKFTCDNCGCESTTVVGSSKHSK